VGSVFRVWKGVSMLLIMVLLIYIYTACWQNNYVVQLCPFWCNSYGARLSRLLTYVVLILNYISVEINICEYNWLTEMSLSVYRNK